MFRTNKCAKCGAYFLYWLSNHERHRNHVDIKCFRCDNTIREEPTSLGKTCCYFDYKGPVLNVSIKDFENDGDIEFDITIDPPGRLYNYVFNLDLYKVSREILNRKLAKNFMDTIYDMDDNRLEKIAPFNRIALEEFLNSITKKYDE